MQRRILEARQEKKHVNVTDMLKEKLQSPNVELERAHRTGQGSNQRHHPVIARFVIFHDREAALRLIETSGNKNIYK